MTADRASWSARHKIVTTLLALCLTGCAGNAGADEAAPDRSAQDQTIGADAPGSQDDSEQTAGKTRRSAQTSDDAGERDRERRDRRERRVDARPERSKPKPRPAPKPAPQPTALVARVIDGDTLELANGRDVRIVGIDTPEVGECGYEAASANLARLVEGKQVRLTRSDEDTDRYGRLLRYVNVDGMDAGLRLIKNGMAIARYDSRDGYGFHPREPIYIAADRAKGNITCSTPAPAPAPSPAGAACASGYSPCVPSFPPDVDCADVNGPVRVTGPDPHGLDADGDGTACE